MLLANANTQYIGICVTCQVKYTGNWVIVWFVIPIGILMSNTLGDFIKKYIKDHSLNNHKFADLMREKDPDPESMRSMRRERIHVPL